MSKLNIRKLLVKKSYSLGVALGTGLLTGILAISMPKPTTLECNPGLAAYHSLKLEMSLTGVQATLGPTFGPGIETESTQNTMTYIWKQPNGTSITVAFEDNKLTKKQQKGLNC